MWSFQCLLHAIDFRHWFHVTFRKRDRSYILSLDRPVTTLAVRECHSKIFQAFFSLYLFLFPCSGAHMLRNHKEIHDLLIDRSGRERERERERERDRRQYSEHNGYAELVRFSLFIVCRPQLSRVGCRYFQAKSLTCCGRHAAVG